MSEHDKTGSYVVLGAGTINRNYKPTIEEAIEHAKRLIRSEKRPAYGSKPPTKLFVVKLVKVVEIKGPPIDVRDPEAYDVQIDGDD